MCFQSFSGSLKPEKIQIWVQFTYLLIPGRYNPSWVLASRTILLLTVLSQTAVSIFQTPRDSRSLWMLSCHLIRGHHLDLFPSGDFSETDFMIRVWPHNMPSPSQSATFDELDNIWRLVEISEFQVGPTFELIRRHVLSWAKDNSKNFPFEPQQRFFVHLSQAPCGRASSKISGNIKTKFHMQFWCIEIES